MSPPSQQTMLVAVLVLLILWLLTRAEQRQRAAPTRRKPMTPDELGRVVFEIARAQDLEAFRHLYLNGVEAREVVGPGVQAYLGRRDKRWLEEEFLEISVRAGPTSRFESMRITPEGEAWLRVSTEAVGAYEIPVGRAVLVQRIWRLRDPVGDWTPHRWVGAKQPS